MFKSVLIDIDSTLTFLNAALCIVTAIGLGLIISVSYMLSGKFNKGFVISLVLLPVLIQVIIMLVNGNLGVGMAVLGAFSLIRFRSVPGSSRDISAILTAMAVGLATGMGYLMFAAVVTVTICFVFVLLSRIPYGTKKLTEKILRITIPENLDYNEIFDEIFNEYVEKISLEIVKTTSMGSMYQLEYLVSLKADKSEKDFIDALRCRNGNMPISISRQVSDREEL